MNEWLNFAFIMLCLLSICGIAYFLGQLNEMERFASRYKPVPPPKISAPPLKKVLAEPRGKVLEFKAKPHYNSVINRRDKK